MRQNLDTQPSQNLRHAKNSGSERNHVGIGTSQKMINIHNAASCRLYQGLVHCAWESVGAHMRHADRSTNLDTKLVVYIQGPVPIPMQRIFNCTNSYTSRLESGDFSRAFVTISARYWCNFSQ